MENKSNKTEASHCASGEDPAFDAKWMWDFQRERIEPYLKKWWNHRSIPPFVMLVGPDGSGKRQIQAKIAQWLFCDRFAEGDFQSEACGQCLSCMRFVNRQEVNWVEFADDQQESLKQEPIKIEELRDLKESLGRGAYGRSIKVVGMVNAERMTLQAANSLLKLLEEPPPGWVFLWTVSDLSKVLPTLVSRAQRVSLRPLSPAVVENTLRDGGVAEAEAKAAASASQGNWNRALLLLSESGIQRREQVLRFLARPTQEFALALEDFQDQKEKPAHLAFQFQLFLRELITWSIQEAVVDPAQFAWSDPVVGRYLVEHVRWMEKRFSRQKAQDQWIGLFDRCQQFVEWESLPLNSKMMVQELLLSWASLES